MYQPTQDVNSLKLLQAVTTDQIPIVEQTTNFWAQNSVGIGEYAVFLFVMIIFALILGYLWGIVKNLKR